MHVDYVLQVFLVSATHVAGAEACRKGDRGSSMCGAPGTCAVGAAIDSQIHQWACTDSVIDEA